MVVIKTNMKKIALFVLGIIISGVAIGANITIDTKQQGEELNAFEFNQILDVVSQFRNNNGSLGVNEEPSAGVKLDVNGIIQTNG